MSLERVIHYFEQFDMADRICVLSDSSATVALAAAVIGCAPKEIAKTMSFLVEGKPLLIVTAGDAKIDNRKYKACFQVKAKMIPSDQVEKLIGHDVGGVCPFGINDGIDVYLVVSLRRFTEVYPAAGSANSMIKMTLPELERYAQAKEWVDVCKDWKEA